MRLRIIGVIAVTVLAIFIFAGLVSAQKVQNAIFIDTANPHYTQPVALHWQLNSTPTNPSLVVTCSQSNVVKFQSSKAIPRARTGSDTIIVSNTTGNIVPGTIDYSQTANCVLSLYNNFGGVNQTALVSVGY